ncbi:MAG: S9 family peptidase [Myxococcales bacterium]|nr:S9 family peptidase [Myxococcales bacterium]
MPGAGALVFSWAVTGTQQIYRLDGPNRFPVQLTGGEDATAIVNVTPDGKTLVVARDTKGEEYPGLYLQSKDGGPLRVVMHKPKVQARAHRISKDGRYLYFTANDKKPDAYVVYRWDFKESRVETVFEQDGLWSVFDTSGSKLLLAKATGSLSREIHELDLDKKTLVPLLGASEKEEYEVTYGKSEGELFVLTNKLGEYRRLYRAKRAGGAGDKVEPFVALSPELKADVTGFVVDDARTVLLYNVNEGGSTRLRVLDLASGKERPTPAVPDADHVRIASVARDGRHATLLVRTSGAPAIPLVLDLKANKVTPWALPSAPELDTASFVKATLEHYVAKDGTKIPMFVRRPKSCASEPCPVVVHFHGGPEAQSLSGFSAWAQLFVDAGFVWIDPNVRGSDGYGKAYLRADDGAKRLDVIGDIEDAAKHVRAAFAKNGKEPKVGVIGGSYGGYATLMAMTRFAGSYDAGVSIVGIANLVTFLNNTAPYRRALRISEYGDPEKDKEALVKLSPTTHVGNVKAPLLLIQGANDPRVPAGEAIQMVDALAARGVTTGLILFADEGHGSQKRENRVLELGHALRFMREHLMK